MQAQAIQKKQTRQLKNSSAPVIPLAKQVAIYMEAHDLTESFLCSFIENIEDVDASTAYKYALGQAYDLQLEFVCSILNQILLNRGIIKKSIAFDNPKVLEVSAKAGLISSKQQQNALTIEQLRNNIVHDGFPDDEIAFIKQVQTYMPMFEDLYVTIMALVQN